MSSLFILRNCENLSFDFSNSTKNVYVKKYNQNSHCEFEKGCKIQGVDEVGSRDEGRIIGKDGETYEVHIVSWVGWLDVSLTAY